MQAKVPTEITADLDIRGVQNLSVNLEQACNDFSKTWLQSSSAVHAKVSLVSLPTTILLLISRTFWNQFSKIKTISYKAASQRLRQLQFWLLFPVGVCFPQSFFGGGCNNTTCPKRCLWVPRGGSGYPPPFPTLLWSWGTGQVLPPLQWFVPCS